MSKKSLSRRGERESAFRCLYGLAFVPACSEAELRERFRQSPPVWGKNAGTSGFAWELVYGVWKEMEELDGVIARFAHNWRPDRMGKVELSLLRLAVYELLRREDIPSGVSINEALELSRQFGDTGARAFVNGILDAAAGELRPGEKPEKSRKPPSPQGDL